MRSSSEQADLHVHPLELIDPDGEGIYVLPSTSGGRSRALVWAAQALGCYWREMSVETVAFLRDGDEYRRTSFRSWRWMLPKRWAPIAYLYCTPPKVERDEIVERLLNAQAELQTGLGMFRLDSKHTSRADREAVIEGYLARSLRMQQHLLAKLGHQMYGGPAESDPETERHA